MANLTNDHFNAFGRITYGYAAVETGIKLCVSAMARIHAHDGFILSAPYPAQALANVAKVLANENLKPELRKEMIGLVDRWIGHNLIRTYVAHHRWRDGARPGAIRPTFYDVRTPNSVVKGFEDDEKDYTTAELFLLANNLHQLNEDVKAFFANSGLEAVLEKIDAEHSGQAPI